MSNLASCVPVPRISLKLNFNYENGPKWVVPPYVTQDFDNVIANVIRGSQTVPGAGVSFWGGLIQAKSGSTTNIKNSNFNNSSAIIKSFFVLIFSKKNLLSNFSVG